MCKNANIWPKMTKNAYFGPNLAFFGPKILILKGGSKNFGTHITEKHLGTLFALFFGREWDKMGQKCQYLAQNDQNCIFCTKFGLFGPKILILTGGSKSFGTHITEKPPGQLVHISFLRGIGSNGPKKPIFGQIWPFLSQKFIFGGME